TDNGQRTKLKRDLRVVTAGLRLRVAEAVLGVRGRLGRRPGRGGRGPRGAAGGAAVLAPPGPGVEGFNPLDRDLMLRPLLAGLLVVPLVELQSAFEENLRPLAEVLFDEVGGLAELPPVEGVTVDEHRVRVVLPLPRLRVLAAPPDREAELDHLAAPGQRPARLPS